MSRYDPDYRERRTNSRRSGLNEFFINGDGINREVLQNEISRYLGPDAYARPCEYGVSYLVIDQCKIC